MHVTLEQQLACAKRELALRQRVYPRFIDQGRISSALAARELAAMAAIIVTLEELIDERTSDDA